MGSAFVCPLCGNSDPRYLGKRNGETYCRRCISFSGGLAVDRKKPPKRADLTLGYELSKEQEELSAAILDNYVMGIDSLVYAVCGAGKTELSYRVIGHAVANGQNVGFALPRRDVVIELEERIRNAFRGLKVVSVYGGHAEKLEGDIVILTTHQLYRYRNYFDLLVMDEVDAFPFKGNDVLEAMFRRALRGHYVKMSATPSPEALLEHHKEGKAVVELKTRFHKKPIPVPVIRQLPGLTALPYLVSKLLGYRRKGKPALVFVPTVDEAARLYRRLAPFVSGGNYVTSKKEDRAGVISDFKNGRYGYLVTTAVLERGVTVRDLQVIVYGADSPVYDAASLIQIAGRVGRKKGAENGEVVFLSGRISREMENSIREIRSCNAHLQMLF